MSASTKATTAAITLSSPLPASDLFLESMSVSEGLSQLGGMHLHLLSEKTTLKAAQLLGKPITITANLANDCKRFFHGYVTRFGIATPKGRFFTYRAEVQPWLWFLTRTSDCRIFQEMSVPDIVKKVFDDHAAVAQVKFELFRTYKPWAYCVQYRESDFQFVTRLLEREGIYWYFEHTHDKHVLVLLDSLSAHDAMAGVSEIRYIEDPSSSPPDVEFIYNWESFEQVKSGKAVLTSYDFERPATSLATDASATRSHDHADGELFDFQGDYTQATDGKQYAEDWLDEYQCRAHLLSGEGNAMGLQAGRTFHLTKHPHEDQNTQYLLTRVDIEARAAVFDVGGQGSSFMARFDAIPASQQFRPPRATPKPIVQGPQTAVVVGPDKEEIFTDKYGRVKVQFHWDRRGEGNEWSSCWVRVSQEWAGQSFGVVYIPRIGQEVVVSFLEGDPDQPLITGRVYNAEHMPPWELPTNATQSGVLTRSSKGGVYGNANAIRFEDKKGSEELWMHAEKNQLIEVENDEVHTVGHDRSKTIDNDETVRVKHDRTETVGNNESISIGKDRTITVGNNESASVEKQRTHSVGTDEDISVGENQSITVGKDQTLQVAKNRKEEVGDALETTVGKKETRSVGDDRETSITKNDKTQVGKKFYLDAGDEITLKSGDASLVLKKDGTIQLKGKDITVVGSGKIGVKASGDLVLKGAKMAEN